MTTARGSRVWASIWRRAARVATCWLKAAPFPEPEEELYSTVINGKLYVVGGFGFTPKGATPPPPTQNVGPCFSCPPGLVYEYDPGPDKWTKRKTIPVRVHHQAQAGFNGKLYIFGGCTRAISGEGGVDNVWEYDPATDTSEVRENLIDGLVGGTDGQAMFASLATFRRAA